MLDDLRTVHWQLALAIFACGAALAVAVAQIADGGDPLVTLRHVPAPLHSGDRSLVEPGASAMMPEPEGESPLGQQLSYPRLVGQRFMVGLHGAIPTTTLLADARKGEIGGIVLFPEGSTPTEVKAANAKLQSAAHKGGNPPLFIAIDQEGGEVRRFEHAPPRLPLSSVSMQKAQREGEETGSYLRSHGVNVDLAPVVDLDTPGSFIAARTISADAGTVARIASAFQDGLIQTLVMPVAKHFPGLGSASANTDLEKSVVASLGRSLLPYQRLIVAGLPAVMVSTAFYEQLDGAHGAAWSKRVVEGTLREDLGFEGVVISDDLSSDGVAQSLAPPQAAVAAAKAGVDVVMIAQPESFRPAYEATLSAAEAGRIPRENLIASYGRIALAKRRFAP